MAAAGLSMAKSASLGSGGGRGSVRLCPAAAVGATSAWNSCMAAAGRSMAKSASFGSGGGRGSRSRPGESPGPAG
jgi:hypothetical protein